MQVPAISFANYDNNYKKVNFAGIKDFRGGSDAALDLVYGDLGRRAAKIGAKLKKELDRQTAEVANEYKKIGYLLPGNPFENRRSMVGYMFRCIADEFDCDVKFN